MGADRAHIRGIWRTFVYWNIESAIIDFASCVMKHSDYFYFLGIGGKDEGSWDRQSWGQEEMWGIVANLQNPSSEVQVSTTMNWSFYLHHNVPCSQVCVRPVLQEESHLTRAVWFLHQGEDRGREPDRQVEEAGLWESVLPPVHPNQRHQLRHQLHLPRAQEQAGGGPDSRVHSLRVSRMLGIVWECQ